MGAYFYRAFFYEMGGNMWKNRIKLGVFGKNV